MIARDNSISCYFSVSDRRNEEKMIIKPPSRKISFRRMLFQCMALVSILPILALGIFSSLNTYGTFQDNKDQLMDLNLSQINNNINIGLAAYEDLEYQIYTNDDVVAWVRMIDEGKDVPAMVNQTRRYINGLLNTKEYIRAITIVTEGGNVITYDTMTAVSTDSSWIDNFSLGIDELYEEVTSDYNKHVFSTEYATTFANKDYYLFHMAHRIVNYKNLEERLGMVIVSLDEELLQSIYAPESGVQDRKDFDDSTYILDKEGKIISYKNDSSYIGKQVDINCENEKKQLQEYLKQSSIQNNQADVYSYYDEKYDWTLVSVIDYISLRKSLFLQTMSAAGIAMAVLIVAFLLSLGISRRLNAEISRVASEMGRAKDGDLTSRIEIYEDTTEEIETMANAYNDMIDKLRESTEKERIATQKHQEAHIVALEAQINPHFLYNTLDTINWMAIEKDEFDISNAINALATILRYAIAKSNAKVTVKDEIEWLKKYIFLQQFRLKDKFVCELDVDPDIVDAPIHKLLMQPFIENAIIHGFEDSIDGAKLIIRLKKEDSNIVISIIDNGKGMPEESVNQINEGKIEGKDRTHIGMGNVITRMKMYYGDSASVSVNSEVGKGTTIVLRIPYEKNE